MDLCISWFYPSVAAEGFLFFVDVLQRMRTGHIVWQVIHRRRIRSAQKIVWQLPEHIRNPGTGEFHLTLF
jgi:hypothetical protein